MNFQILACTTSVVAQGNTTIALATFLPLNALFNKRARINPSNVESPTTATVHTSVFFKTMEKVGVDRILVKLSSPENPLINPALLTLLNAIRNTNTIGTRINISISKMLGKIQRYGSILRINFFTGNTSFSNEKKRAGLFTARPDILPKSGLTCLHHKMQVTQG